ncbi:hypothetical protein SXCC_01994 [Gluconacetobacter sp. SXCC-1]|nr:hypothetical protein SXCC_01994 [Gluconacetobacter sp. SXCC-1]
MGIPITPCAIDHQNDLASRKPTDLGNLTFHTRRADHIDIRQAIEGI